MSVKMQSASGYGIDNGIDGALPHQAVAGSRLVEPDSTIFFESIADTNFPPMEQLHECGDSVVFTTDPNIGGVHEYEIDQALQLDTFSMSSFQLHICNAHYKAFKLDDLTLKKIKCWEDFYGENLDSILADKVAMEFNRKHQNMIIADLIAGTATTNKGTIAGLGTPNDPLIVDDEESATRLIMMMKQVIQDAGFFDVNLNGSGNVRDGMSQMYCLMPEQLMSLIQLDTMLNIYNTTPLGAGIYSAIPTATSVLGARVITYNQRTIPVRKLPGDRVVYPVILGNKDAYKFSRKLIDAQFVSSDTQLNSFANSLKYLVTSGGHLLYNQAIAVAYISVPRMTLTK